MKIRTRLLLVLLHVAGVVCAQSPALRIDKVEPPFWWTGMADGHLQLLVKGPNVSSATASVAYEGVKVERVTPAAHADFLFVDLQISRDAQPGTLKIDFTYGDNAKIQHDYELKARTKDEALHQGLDQGDVIYLITPDRFVNGDQANDTMEGMKEGIGRSLPGGRHGGDLAGVHSKLDYLEDLGVTTLWLNPVLENNMPSYSYHGYAITDYYKVDPRYGSNEVYRELSGALHERGMKLVMDMVFNHCGLEHWWMKEMPFGDWIHDYPDYVTTNYSIASLSDPHAAESDRRQMEKGWFVPTMPDLNQDNPFMATYLIQNTLWWIEYAGLDGLRIDTYPYNKKEFMALWTLRVRKEYPDLYLVGETWIGHVGQVAYWADKGPDYSEGYNSHTPAMADFPLYFALNAAFREGGNVAALYDVLSQDFMYYDPSKYKVFADNHDVDRLFHSLGGNVQRFKQALTFLLTTRGVPQLYYGTEILMKGSGDHGVIREDFPGGWKEDQRDAFTQKGRTEQERVAYEFVRRLLNWRKGSEAIAHGNLKHFIPHDNLYVYNRKSENESVLIMINNSNESVTVDMARYQEVLEGYDGGRDIISGRDFNDLDTIRMDGNTSLVLELKPLTRAVE